MTNMPECFGKYWDESEVVCSGGYDPSYVALNGSKNRERCPGFNTCRTRTSLVKANEQLKQQQVIPPSQLFRGQAQPAQQAPAAWRPPTPVAPPAPAPTVPTAPLTWAQHQQWQQAQQAQQAQMQQWQQQQWQQMQMQQQMPPWLQYPQQFQAQVQQQPLQMMPVSYDMPSYLTVTEDRNPGTFWTNLLHELLRGMGKAAGHSLASFFDHVKFR